MCVCVYIYIHTHIENCVVQLYNFFNPIFLLALEKSVFPTMIVDLSISSFNAADLCFIYFKTMFLSTYIFEIVIPYCQVIPFIILIVMKCLFLSLVTLLALESCLILGQLHQLSFGYCMHCIFFNPFVFSVSVSLYLKCVFYKQHIF